MKLYRLKSNKTTIVREDNGYHKIVWTKSMENCDLCDSRWMMHRWNPENVVLLTDEESERVMTKYKSRFGVEIG
jgi:hypothetical protein